MLQRGASQKTCLDLKHGSLRPQRKIGHCSAVAVYVFQEEKMKRNLKLVSLLLVLVLALGAIPWFTIKSFRERMWRICPVNMGRSMASVTGP